MKKVIFIIIIVLGIFINQIAAQEFSSQSVQFRNPFKSSLPEEPIIQKSVQKPKGNKKPKQVTPKLAKEIKPPSLSISGLIWNSDHPQAIVNNHIVNIGDTIKGWKIVRIHKDGIDVKYEGKVYSVKKITKISQKMK